MSPWAKISPSTRCSVKSLEPILSETPALAASRVISGAAAGVGVPDEASSSDPQPAGTDAVTARASSTKSSRVIFMV